MGSGVRNDPMKAYRQAESVRSADEREQEILRHLPLVRTVVDRVTAHLPFRALCSSPPLPGLAPAPAPS